MVDQVADDSATAAAMRRAYFDMIVRQRGRDLTRDELHSAIGPRFPSGSLENRLRGLRIRTLNRKGFTFNRQRI